MGVSALHRPGAAGGGGDSGRDLVHGGGGAVSMSSKGEQLNFAVDLERKDQEERWFQENTAMYEKWLTLPDKTLVKDGTTEREHLSGILRNAYCKLYQRALHECQSLPEDEYIWMNPGPSRNYWVLNKRGVCGGEHIETCPYCGAELGKGKGDAVLYKAEEKYWLFYLHFDVPMRQLGYQPKEDREAIKRVWG